MSTIAVDSIKPTTRGEEDYWLCRSWIKFDGTTTPASITQDGNVSTLLDINVGIYRPNFANALSSGGYAAAGFASNQDNNNIEGWDVGQNSTKNWLSTSIQIRVTESNGSTTTHQDSPRVELMCVGNELE